MKKKVLALLLPILLAAGAANAAEIYSKNGNKLDLYGKVDTRYVFSEDTTEDGDATYVRLGFKGEAQINSDLIGFGQWEYSIRADEVEDGSANTATRLGFAGLKFSDYGSSDYGRNYGVLYDIEAWTDMLPVWGGDSYTYTDNFMTGRTNGVAIYCNADFSGLVEGLSFVLQYQGANESENSVFGQGGANNGRNVRKQNSDGFDMSTTYDFDMGITAGAAFSTSDRTNGQQYGTTADDERAEAWTAGLKYNANDIYLATMYAETRNMTPVGSSSKCDNCFANKTQNFEIAAQYQFDFGLRPEISYLQSKGKNLTEDMELITNKYNNKDLVKYVSIGASHYFNKNFSTYVDYKINLLDGDDAFYGAVGISTDDVVGIGMTYQF